MSNAKPVMERALSKFAVDPETGCWAWLGTIRPDGYGEIALNETCDGGRGKMLAHRLVFEHYRGRILDGLTLDHLCRNRWCVNPDHLEAVTLAENVMRGVGPCAQKARQTHCKNGHSFEEYGYRDTQNRRKCLMCERNKAVTRWQKVKAARG